MVQIRPNLLHVRLTRVTIQIELLAFVCVAALGCAHEKGAASFRPDPAWLGSTSGEFDADEWETITDTFDRLHLSPLPLNTVTPDALRQIPLLSENALRTILAVRTNIGVISDYRFLGKLPAHDRQIIEWTTFIDTPDEASHRPSGYISQRLERVWRSNTRSLAGNPLKSVWKMRYRWQGLNASVTTSKDPYEPVQFRPRRGWYGYDHTIFSVRWTSPQDYTHLYAGSFLVIAGQGLLFSLPFDSRLPTRTPSGVGYRSARIKPNTSSVSFVSLNGIGIEQRISDDVRILAFVSANQADATMQGSDGDIFFRLRTGGLHRNEAENRSRRRISTHSVGAVSTITRGRLSLGGGFVLVSMNRPVLLKSHVIPGMSWSGMTIFGSYKTPAVRVGGELSRSTDEGSRWLISSFVRSGKWFSIGIHVRRYPSPTSGLYASSPGLRSSFGDQTGWFSVARIGLTGRVSMYLSTDILYGHLPAGTGIVPADRSDLRVSGLIKINRETTLEVGTRNTVATEVFTQKRSSGAGVYASSARTTRNIFVILKTRISDALLLGGSVRRSSTALAGEKVSPGIFSYMETTADISPRITFRFRTSLFDIRDSDGRIYAYEWDVPGKLSVPGFSGRGEKVSLLVSLIPSVGWQLDLKLARTRKTAITSFTDFWPGDELMSAATIVLRKTL